MSNRVNCNNIRDVKYITPKILRVLSSSQNHHAGLCICLQTALVQCRPPPLHACNGTLALPPPPPRPDIKRITSLRVLGVIVNDKLTAADHVTMPLSLFSSLLYAMQVLRSHGTPTTSVVTRIQYAAQAWSGMSSATNRACLDYPAGGSALRPP